MNLIVLQQLYAMRAQIEAAILQLETESQREIAEAGCVHPADKQRDASTLGGPKMLVCLVCGQERPGMVAS